MLGLKLNHVSKRGHFTKEVNPRLAKRPLVFNERLANRELSSSVKEAIGRNTFYIKISQTLGTAKFVFGIVRSPWNLTVVSAAILPKRQSNFKAMLSFQRQISRLRYFNVFR